METLADVRAEGFDIANGQIRNPGKFEAESWYAPIIYEWMMDGDGEYLGPVTIFEVSDVERDMFELDREHVALVLEVSDQGFVSVVPVNAQTLETLREDIESEESEDFE